ncbi:MAG: hypothetical protein ACK5MK_11320 [Dysgonomonas sp.]
MIYNPYTKELWSYDLDSPTISIFDFLTNKWSMNDLQLKNPNFSQHNSFILPKDSALYIWCGYGN